MNSTYHTTSDASLLELYRQNGDLTVIGALFERYRHLVYGVCMKYLKDPDDSKDAVMQLFEKLITELRKHEVQSFKAWLHTVTKNHCLMILRKKKSHGFENSAYTDSSLAVVEMESLWHPESGPEKERQLQELEAAIQQLNEGQRQCIELFYLQEKSYQEVTDITGYSMLQVKSYIQNGKRNLKIVLEKKHAG